MAVSTSPGGAFNSNGADTSIMKENAFTLPPDYASHHPSETCGQED